MAVTAPSFTETLRPHRSALSVLTFGAQVCHMATSSPLGWDAWRRWGGLDISSPGDLNVRAEPRTSTLQCQAPRETLP